MLKIREDVDLKELEKFGYFISHVSVLPKKIKFGNIELEYSEENEDYYRYYGGGLFEHKFENCKNFLNDDVEIIEEDKKIEKIARCDSIKMTHYGELYKPTENEEILRIKINELIDEINNLKEND